jgi:hypothetical protein
MSECDPYSDEDGNDENRDEGYCYDDYDQEDPFLWGNNREDYEEVQTEADWPGKRQDSLYDYLTH